MLLGVWCNLDPIFPGTDIALRVGGHKRPKGRTHLNQKEQFNVQDNGTEFIGRIWRDRGDDRGRGWGRGGGHGPGRGGGRASSWLVRWRDLDTGRNISGWVQSGSPTCGHGNSCDCNGQNYCGTYSGGETALFWERGCRSRPARIVCDAQRQR